MSALHDSAVAVPVGPQLKWPCLGLGLTGFWGLPIADHGSGGPTRSLARLACITSTVRCAMGSALRTGWAWMFRPSGRFGLRPCPDGIQASVEVLSLIHI
eukprot:170465-Alexandrium_andersonii.AAC.1